MASRNTLQVYARYQAALSAEFSWGGVDVFDIKARSGITHAELKILLQDLEERWHLKHDITGSQVDIEEAIAEKEMA